MWKVTLAAQSERRRQWRCPGAAADAKINLAEQRAFTAAMAGCFSRYAVASLLYDLCGAQVHITMS